EVGEQDGRPYIALEFVDGGSLEQRLAGTPLPAPRAAALVETLARAVHYAHQRGVIHRDLKPAHVLLTADCAPKITNFSLARSLAGAAQKGRGSQGVRGATVGAPSYMAPELAAGNTKAMGPAAAVYGLGPILYERLTGRPPFLAESPLETLRQVQSEEPV